MNGVSLMFVKHSNLLERYDITSKRPLQCNVVYDVNNPEKGYVVGTAVVRPRASQKRLFAFIETLYLQCSLAKIHRWAIFLVNSRHSGNPNLYKCIN